VSRAVVIVFYGYESNFYPPPDIIVFSFESGCIFRLLVQKTIDFLEPQSS